ncbi:hypothetical protein KM043_001452 [Ampulex compressa]|nr:hypothetical protein KM043_001452 [Ampulex compressa]
MPVGGLPIALRSSVVRPFFPSSQEDLPRTLDRARRCAAKCREWPSRWGSGREATRADPLVAASAHAYQERSFPSRRSASIVAASEDERRPRAFGAAPPTDRRSTLVPPPPLAILRAPVHPGGGRGRACLRNSDRAPWKTASFARTTTFPRIEGKEEESPKAPTLLGPNVWPSSKGSARSPYLSPRSIENQRDPPRSAQRTLRSGSILRATRLFAVCRGTCAPLRAADRRIAVEPSIRSVDHRRTPIRERAPHGHAPAERSALPIAPISRSAERYFETSFIGLRDDGRFRGEGRTTGRDRNERDRPSVSRRNGYKREAQRRGKEIASPKREGSDTERISICETAEAL